ncbi:hypothetical protein [Paenibacillus sp. GCM10028914]|uniref:hypothetical protein n=1 Tax=Paenibacillus sp. GCM10028914 TaxID=3273416 RepID=UPI00361CC09F
MKRRTTMIIVLIALVLLIGITLYRFIDSLGESYQQLGLIQNEEPMVVYTTGLFQK